MSNKELDKIDELIDATEKCDCSEPSCDCTKDVCDCSIEENIETNECFYCDGEDCDCVEEGFTGTYTVNFDGLCDELSGNEDECKVDSKKVALVGVGAVLAGGTMYYVFKKKKNKKNK